MIPYFQMKCRLSSSVHNVAMVTLRICYLFLEFLPFLPILLYTDERARVDKRVFWPQYFRKIEYVCLIGF